MKRCLTIVAVFLLAGVASNVAVAWGCWLESDMSFRRMSLLGQLSPADSLEIAEDMGFAPQVNPDGIPIVHADGWTIHCGSGTTLDTLQINRVEIGLFGEIAHYSHATARRTQAGWPVHAMRGYEITASDDAIRWDGRPPFPPLPVWPGFAVNTLLYAATLWLLIRGPFVPSRVIRFRRARRGLCPKCAYPIGGSAVCTECGYHLRS